MTDEKALQSLLNAVADGSLSTDAAFSQLKDLAYESVGDFAKIDHQNRLKRVSKRFCFRLDQLV